jgi:putative hemolysin
VRPPIFVPEFTRVSALLKEFQRTREYLAFVVDEYGSVQGLVTLEQVVEQIVGDIREPGEAAPTPYVSRLPDGAYLIDGMASVRKLRNHLGLPIPERSEYTTLAGFLLFTLETIPRPGASLNFWRLRLDRRGHERTEDREGQGCARREVALPDNGPTHCTQCRAGAL